MTALQALERLKSVQAKLVPLRDILTNPAMQPRVERMIPIRDTGRAKESSERHICTFRQVLESLEGNELEPILIAFITERTPILEPGLYVVDGHHRLKAYERTGREAIPARILPMDCRTAVMVSKLVNCTGRSLEMHPEQCRDAAWQYLADVTQRGAAELPKGESLRSVAARYGISKGTVSSMLAYLPSVELKGFHPMTIDPGTGWPRWRYVREAGKGWHTSLPATPGERFNREAEKAARQAAKFVETYAPAIRARALEMLANDEVYSRHQVETVEFLSVIGSPLIA